MQAVHARIQRRPTAALISLALAVAGLAALAPATPASAALNDLVVKNDGARSFGICRSAASDTTCSGPTGTLASGENSKSKYGWSDTDMIQLAGGCTLHKHTYLGAGQHGWQLYAVATTTRWVKVPGWNGATQSFKVTC